MQRKMEESMNEAQSPLAVVVLAAGQGTRMKSSRAKVLHEICGVPMLGHIQRVAEGLGAARLIVVVGRDADEVKETYGSGAEFVLQAEQRGTGHAVMMAEPKLCDFEGDVLVLYGDTPLLRVSTLERMRALKASSGADLVMLTASGDVPGRVLRDADGRVERIVEAQDASEAELAIAERNTGVYLLGAPLLREGLANLRNDNQQGELYITDVVGFAVERGYGVEALWLEDADECLGINSRAELAAAATIMRRRINDALMADGVSLIDPESTYIDATVKVGRDTVIEPGCHITGTSVIGEGAHIKANCYIEDSRLDDGVIFGPYSHLRPGCHLMQGVKIGNFVEVKNSTLGAGSKSAHLTYIGDADVGEQVNFGCGSVVVNYDGYQKSRSRVGDGAFIGCNVNLISPVEIERGAFLAAGSTVTKDVPEDALAVARARQKNIEGWRARKEGRPKPEDNSSEQGTAPTLAASKTRGTKAGGSAAKRAAPRRKAAVKKPARKKAAGKKAARKKATRKKATRKKAAKKKAAKKKSAGKAAKRKPAKQGTRKRVAKKKAQRRRAGKR
jgi:bifunctional UDP-N-acetylglucosamine pyrophosphorylase/glucosamine-1-phosphate N-acetyltransferase